MGVGGGRAEAVRPLLCQDRHDLVREGQDGTWLLKVCSALPPALLPALIRR